jgi:hypothetical protein
VVESETDKGTREGRWGTHVAREARKKKKFRMDQTVRIIESHCHKIFWRGVVDKPSK